MMPKQHVGDFKLIHHLQCFAGGSVNDFIDPRLCSCSCALLDYSIDMLKKDVQVRANGLSRHEDWSFSVYSLQPLLVSSIFHLKVCFVDIISHLGPDLISLQTQACKSARGKRSNGVFCLCPRKLTELQQSLPKGERRFYS